MFEVCRWLVIPLKLGHGWGVKSIVLRHSITYPYPNPHDDVIKWKHFPRYWPFVWGIHRWPVNSPHKGQWRGALMFSLICAWINGWVNNGEAGDLRRHRPHYDVIAERIPTTHAIPVSKSENANIYFVFLENNSTGSFHNLFVVSNGTKCRWLMFVLWIVTSGNIFRFNGRFYDFCYFSALQKQAMTSIPGFLLFCGELTGWRRSQKPKPFQRKLSHMLRKTN